MFDKIPTIDKPQEILEIAFKKSKKIIISDRHPFYKKKKTILAKIESFSTSIINRFKNYEKKFPSIDNLPKFYQELIDIKISVDKLKHSLGTIGWAKKTCEHIFLSQIKYLRKTNDIKYLIKKEKEIYGRISSVVKQVGKDLEYLSNAGKILKKFPIIEDIDTVVLAGYPNVGKSSLLKSMSKAKPKIATYPFTTKEIFIGHIIRKKHYIDKKIQIIDTPGLLDRAIDKKNDIELQAIAAMKYLTSLIVFILDPSETCGYSLKDQKSLLNQIKKMFIDSEIIIVENKTDLKKTKSKYLQISCQNNKGIEKLIDEIFRYFED